MHRSQGRLHYFFHLPPIMASADWGKPKPSNGTASPNAARHDKILIHFAMFYFDGVKVRFMEVRLFVPVMTVCNHDIEQIGKQRVSFLITSDKTHCQQMTITGVVYTCTNMV